MLLIDVNALIHHALQALQDCLPNDANLTVANTEIALVGVDTPLTLFNEDQV
jgi:hypothetical protein